MSYITPEFVTFFETLKDNNHKAWFDENRKTYETYVKKPFRDLVDEMIGRLNGIEPEIMIEPKDAIFRINRDIRFSKNKQPYKTHLSAIISARGKKDKTYPGLYFELHADRVNIYGGVFQMTKEQLLELRHDIKSHLEEFQAIVNHQDFVNTFGEIKGDKHKRLPKDFQETAKVEPLIANKQFYFHCQLPKKDLMSDQLTQKLENTYRVATDLNNFFKRALYHQEMH